MVHGRACIAPSLWAEQHQPSSEAELVVNKKKVTEVREFLCGGFGRSWRLLVLRGPPGCGKAAVLRGLCADLGVELLEWSPAARGHASGHGAAGSAGPGGLRPEPLGDSFLRFLAETDRYRGLHLGEAGLRPRPRVALVRDFPFTLVDTSRSETARGADFVERFRTMVNCGAAYRAVFCFNDSLEDHRTVSRLFAQVDHSAVRTIHFDGVPRTFVQRALDVVARAEGLDPAAVGTAVLAGECGGDLRHAMNALQLASALAHRCPPQSVCGGSHTTCSRGSGGVGRARSTTRRQGKGLPLPLTQTGNQGVEDAAAAGEAASGTGGDLGLRPASLGLFHALGRLMYCKRIPPGSLDSEAPNKPGKRPRRNGSSGTTFGMEPRQLPRELLVPKSTRPPLYFVPEDVLDSANSDPSQVVDWVFTNAPRFYGNVCDLAEFAVALACADAWGGNVWRSGGTEAIATPLDGLVAAVQVRSVLDANLEPVPPSFSDPCAASQRAEPVGTAAALFNMARPLMRDVARQRDRRMHELNAHLDVAGPQALGAASADQILIVQTLPLVHLMLLGSQGTHHTLRHLPHGLMKLIMELSAPIDGDILRSGAGDGPAQGDIAGGVNVPAHPTWASALPEDPIEDA